MHKGTGVRKGPGKLEEWREEQCPKYSKALGGSQVWVGQNGGAWITQCSSILEFAPGTAASHCRCLSVGITYSFIQHVQRAYYTLGLV